MRWRHLFAISLLAAACSVVRDVDRYSSGEPVVVADAGACKQAGESCESIDECCTGACNGTCTCKPTGAECTAASECCSAECAGTCSACAEFGEPCTVGDTKCCPGRACLSDSAGTYQCRRVQSCTNASDAQLLAGSATILETCESDEACYVSGGLTADCASCLSSGWLCFEDLCLGTCSACQTAPSSVECADCCDKQCLGVFSQCSGLDAYPG